MLPKTRNVEIRGEVVSLTSRASAFFRCPECRRTVKDGVCMVHGEVEPIKDLRIGLRVITNSGEVALEFSGKEAEKTAGITAENAHSLQKPELLNYLETKFVGKILSAECFSLKNDYLYAKKSRAFGRGVNRMFSNPAGRKKRLSKKRRAKIMKGAEAIGQASLTQIKLTPIVNKNLFSDHFLGKILPGRVTEWREDAKIRQVFEKVKQRYLEHKDLLADYNEAQLEDHFVKPILNYLGHHHEVQEKISATRKQPDYAFFPDDKTRRKAHSNKGKISFYENAVAIGDAKSWEMPLDKKTRKGAAFEDQNPSFQIDTYLRDTAPRWAILTNGKCWRIYFQETSYKLNSYFEVDLVDIINKDDLESFKYFYFFFRLEAFLTDERGRNFLYQVYEGSVDYARELGEGLQENVYQALKILAEGFLGLDENKLEKNPETIKEIHDNALVLLYRVLFALYAESRGLLDVSNETYARTFSFNSIKREVAESIDRGEELHSWHIHYWNRLKNLFSLINEGSESRGIPKEDLFIPPYNGSLFNPSKHEFLGRHAVGDSYLAKVIDLLSRSNGGFIDYSTLDIRHLGSIYEGLLEFKLKIAEGDIVSIREKGKEVWVPRDEAGEKEIHEEVEEGGLYLVTDRGERKATGSYYTPGYIVKYIVGNTLGPIVEQKIEKVRENGGKESEAILSINVLDPAMGSGHFLVEAVDFLARPLLEAVSNDVEKGLIPEAEYSTEWAKREVVGHCIYGVDLNPLAVELAKLSLWLATIAKDKPLSFLDHRLKCGNSLIGTSLEDLPWHPEKKKQDRKQKRIDISGFVKKLVDTTKKLSEISDDTLDNIKQKEKIFSEFKETIAYDMIKTLADVRTSIHFGNEIDEKTYGTYTGDAWWSSETEWKQRRNRPFAQKAREIAGRKKFFHWELEFPEVFFEAGEKKDNPGFGAVVGNPPYLSVKRGFLLEDTSFFESQFDLAKGQWDAYALFIEQSFNILKNRGAWSFIIPKPSLSNENLEPLRNYWLFKTNVKHILDAGMPFPDPGVEAVVVVSTKEESKGKIEIAETKDGEINILHILHTVDSQVFPQNPFSIFTLRSTPQMNEIIRKVTRIGEPFTKFVKLTRGIEAGKKDECVLDKPDRRGIKLAFGEDLERYQLHTTHWVKRDESNITKFKPYNLYDQAKKLVIRRVADSLISSVESSRAHTLNTIYVAELTGKVNPHYLATLLNSKLLNWWFHYIFVFEDRLFPYARISQLSHLPIRSINFTSINKERKELIEKLKTLYKTSTFDQILQAVELHLPKDNQGNFIIKKEKSDVVHDFLSYLAEQMIELNNQKYYEIRGFLEWLEREVDVRIEFMLNRITIEEYHENTFNKLIEVLKKNKKKLSIDPGRRDFQEKLKKEFDESMTKLTSLKAKIRTTDKLIDQIVYRLYGLTDEEIEIVESSFVARVSLEKKETVDDS